MIVYFLFLLIHFVKTEIKINKPFGLIEQSLPYDLLVTRGQAKSYITVVNRISIGKLCE